jgi:hypothetical protein
MEFQTVAALEQQDKQARFPLVSGMLGVRRTL